MGVIEYEEFRYYMEEIKDVEDYWNELSDLDSKYGYAVQVERPTDRISSALVKLLEKSFNDENNWISYYIWELNFGRDWEPGCVTNEEGTDVKLQEVEDLYDLLIENYLIKLVKEAGSEDLSQEKKANMV